MPKVKDYKKLPSEPGCYIYRDTHDIVLYVGKAKDLKKRVASYFTKKDHDPKTELLVSRIDSIDYFITKNEVEALILENNLIKKYLPRYNIDLKDSRRYAYLRVTDDDIPYVEVARTREEKGRYFGPFVSGRYRREITRILSRYFKVLTQKPSPLKRKSIDKEQYKENLTQAISLLKGNVNALLKDLKKKMVEASKKTHYEYAMQLRNQIAALESLKEKQNMELRRNYDADIFQFIKTNSTIYLVAFNIYKGVLENKQEFEFDHTENFLEEFLLRFYEENNLPNEIIIPQTVDQALIDYFSSQKGTLVHVIVPQKGAKKALLDLALKNIKLSIEGGKTKMRALQTALALKHPPEIIECFDISHLRGQDTVASMVVFKNGEPYKSNYRKFKIRTTGGGDDYGAMREVVMRRYTKSLKDTMRNPDLIVIDGGKGQLSSAREMLDEFNVQIPVISLAKRLEEIFVVGKSESIHLSKKDPALQLLQSIRDEAHRFAITFNRKLRNKRIRK